MTHANIRIVLLGVLVCTGPIGAAGAAAVGAGITATPTDCSKGAAAEQMACLHKIAVTLQERVIELEKETLKWNDRIALRNEDMRLFPRCLDNPGPNSPDVSMVLATSCARTPAQTWMLARPYLKGQ